MRNSQPATQPQDVPHLQQTHHSRRAHITCYHSLLLDQQLTQPSLQSKKTETDLMSAK